MLPPLNRYPTVLVEHFMNGRPPIIAALRKAVIGPIDATRHIRLGVASKPPDILPSTFSLFPR